MTKTEQMLLTVYKAPTLRLEDICEPYFNLNRHNAYVAANAQSLGVSTFRLRDSSKAPIMVRLSDLADYIDSRAGKAHEQWETSQV